MVSGFPTKLHLHVPSSSPESKTLQSLRAVSRRQTFTHNFFFLLLPSYLFLLWQMFLLNASVKFHSIVASRLWLLLASLPLHRRPRESKLAHRKTLAAFRTRIKKTSAWKLAARWRQSGSAIHQCQSMYRSGDASIGLVPTARAIWMCVLWQRVQMQGSGPAAALWTQVSD